ncbi:MAG: radical SAM protein [Gammaproteobacteria bacterium]|nr:radical SAM protein [Gammaproteobacteria bacterium]
MDAPQPTAAAPAPGAAPRRRFLLELIKPSHYDDDGYVIQWHRAFIPSNSLSAVYGIALDEVERKVLGDDVDIEINAYDETATIVPFKKIVRRFKANDNRGLVCLIGVQTNQFPRALDIARQLRPHGIQVAIGGFHASGCLAMLPEMQPDLKEALDMGISLFAGEAEGRLGQVLKDADRRKLEPIYNFMSDLPDMTHQPTPFLPVEMVRRYGGHRGCFDAGRGCPFTCSFCTIINVQGRKSRFRDADDIERLLDANVKQGVKRFFVTDDNFARNKNWEPIFDRIIEYRERNKVKISFMLQVDTLCHKIPNFVEKAAKAGCSQVFIGLENINPDNLKSAHKGQNKITEYRRMLQAWRKHKVLSYCGYILGFPGDTPASIEREVRIVMRELPVDLLEFFILTPLPGSADHRDLYNKGVWMDPDMNKYDLEHITTGHPTMSAEELQAVYDKAWDIVYSPDHIRTLFRRAAVGGARPSKVMAMVLWFHGSLLYEKLHPLQSGLFRRKVRTQRRYGMPRVNPLIFYPMRAWEFTTTSLKLYLYYRRLRRMQMEVLAEPGIEDYTDVAIAPVTDEDTESLEMFQVSDAAKAAVKKAKRLSNIIEKARADIPVRVGSAAR